MTSPTQHTINNTTTHQHDDTITDTTSHQQTARSLTQHLTHKRYDQFTQHRQDDDAVGAVGQLLVRGPFGRDRDRFSMPPGMANNCRLVAFFLRALQKVGWCVDMGEFA
jgi:hypothetical protein